MSMKKALREILNPFESKRKKLGEMMVDSHYLSEDELDELIDEQKSRPDRKLGYLCVERGYTDKTELMDVLTRQMPVVKPFGTK